MPGSDSDRSRRPGGVGHPPGRDGRAQARSRRRWAYHASVRPLSRGRARRTRPPRTIFHAMGSATFAGGVRILSVVGNRPQFVKSAPLSLALRQRGVEEPVLHTGQHYDPELSAVFFEELELAPPRYRLEAGSGTHAEQTGRMLPGIEAAVLGERPDAVLVYGD